MVEGDYFEGNKPRDVLVGRRMAELLEAELGDRLVITVAQAKSGDLSQEMFRISGIFDTGSKEMDEGMVFIRLGKAQKMLAIGKNAHQIAIKLKDTSLSRDESFDLWQRYSKDGNEAASWLTLMPQLKATLGMVDFSMAITVLIVFGLVALVIVNTIFMSLYERMFEFGVMRALGTGSVEIVKLIIFESGALATVSIALGTILGAGVNYLFSIVGFDYSGIEMSGITFEIIYTVIDIRQFVLYPALLFAFTLLVGIYPAVYAAKMKAIEAMRKSI
jgi:ABC-type lipoprotein release transport system permease subunit